jgi:hypothetical protein
MMTMKRNSGFRSFLFLAALFLACGAFMLAQDSSEQNAPASDNTKINQRDRNPNEPTAD